MKLRIKILLLVTCTLPLIPASAFDLPYRVNSDSLLKVNKIYSMVLSNDPAGKKCMVERFEYDSAGRTLVFGKLNYGGKTVQQYDQFGRITARQGFSTFEDSLEKDYDQTFYYNKDGSLKYIVHFSYFKMKPDTSYKDGYLERPMINPIYSKGKLVSNECPSLYKPCKNDPEGSYPHCKLVYHYLPSGLVSKFDIIDIRTGKKLDTWYLFYNFS